MNKKICDYNSEIKDIINNIDDIKLLKSMFNEYIEEEIEMTDEFEREELVNGIKYQLKTWSKIYNSTIVLSNGDKRYKINLYVEDSKEKIKRVDIITFFQTDMFKKWWKNNCHEIEQLELFDDISENCFEKITEYIENQKVLREMKECFNDLILFEKVLK